MQKTITIRDVAKRAGVGISTVSRVVNGGAGLRFFSPRFTVSTL